MRRIEASLRKASALRLRPSQSFASLRHRPSQAKVRSTIHAFDDPDVHALENGPQRILELRPLIAAIGVELQKEGIEAEQRRHQEHAAVAVLNIGAMHDGVHQEALRVARICRFLPLIFLPASYPCGS